MSDMQKWQLRDGDAIREMDLLRVLRFMDYAYTDDVDLDENDAEDK